jgi:hypothetical protein
VRDCISFTVVSTTSVVTGTFGDTDWMLTTLSACGSTRMLALAE